MRRFSLGIAILSLVQADAWDSAEGPAVVPWAGPRPQPPPPPSPDRLSPPNKDLIDYDAFLDTIIQCTNKEMAIAKPMPEFVCRVFFYNFHKYPFINNDSPLLPNGHQFFRTINPNQTSKNTGLCVLSPGDSGGVIVEGKVLKPGDVLWTHFATEEARLCDVHACQCLGDYNEDDDFDDLSHRTDDDYDAFLDTSNDKDDELYDSYDGGCPRNLHNCPSNVSTDIIRGAVGAVIFVAVAAALVGIGVAFGWVVAFISVKMKATKPPAGGGQAQGGVTLSAPAQSTCENKV